VPQLQFKVVSDAAILMRVAYKTCIYNVSDKLSAFNKWNNDDIKSKLLHSSNTVGDNSAEKDIKW